MRDTVHLLTDEKKLSQVMGNGGNGMMNTTIQKLLIESSKDQIRRHAYSSMLYVITSILNLLASTTMMLTIATFKPVQHKEFGTFVLVNITVVCTYSFLIIYIRKPTLATDSISTINTNKQKKLTKTIAAAGLVHVSTNLAQNLSSLPADRENPRREQRLSPRGLKKLHYSWAGRLILIMPKDDEQKLSLLKTIKESKHILFAKFIEKTMASDKQQEWQNIND
uniref:Uncharacterized protein n=1 Tax=Romanomermis culicivorax TaxID=13658 RepID=A0A915K2N3_ROMCU